VDNQPPESRFVVEVRNLRKTYNLGTPGAVEVLHGVNMTATTGEFIAIIGQSGSGKSTLLNILGALDTPTAGEVRIDGVEISALDSDGLAHLRGRKVGLSSSSIICWTSSTVWRTP
jgi:ABC-type lipoprotein export system ATPase subunit